MKRSMGRDMEGVERGWETGMGGEEREREGIKGSGKGTKGEGKVGWKGIEGYGRTEKISGRKTMKV